MARFHAAESRGWPENWPIHFATLYRDLGDDGPGLSPLIAAPLLWLMAGAARR